MYKLKVYIENEPKHKRKDIHNVGGMIMSEKHKKIFSSIIYSFVYSFFSLFLALSCNNKKSISIVSYNTQTFFDAIDDGREFKDFKKERHKWNKEAYDVRLNRMLEAIRICSSELEDDSLPDILALQEVESEEVVKDLCKKLDAKDSYKDAVFIRSDEFIPFSTAILSKHKILRATSHNVYASHRILRPIIEADLLLNIRGKDVLITVFAVHWKSKRDGSKRMRAMQEELLHKRIKVKEKTSDYVIALGDFNQNIDEFSKMQNLNNAWQLYENKTFDEFECADASLGSYSYKGKWERIDHIFYLENPTKKNLFKASKFFVPSIYPLIANGKINRYNIDTGEGYSDHLPIGLLLEAL